VRTIPEKLAAHLAGEETTLCNCWRVTRADGVVMGFTDHDRDLAFDGTRFAAGSGFEASATEEGAGLSAEGSDVRGGFSSEAITEADLAAGRYDGARVELFRVNWQDPAQRLLLKVQLIGEVSRSGSDFTAELRPFTHRLQQPVGRIYARTCAAAFADSACGFQPRDGVHRGAGSVREAISESRLALSGLDGFAADHFARGTLEFRSGGLAGLTAEIAAHGLEAGSAVVDLWLPLPFRPEPGDAVRLTVGCDKRFATCRKRFGNGANFQGFPHMPGSDYAYSYADRDTVHDGGALYP
jgi:uncharacterized phage protein (TIGR02218 family)